MRKDLGNKMNFLPLPVLMIGTYDKVGNAFKDGLKYQGDKHE